MAAATAHQHLTAVFPLISCDLDLLWCCPRLNLALRWSTPLLLGSFVRMLLWLVIPSWRDKKKIWFTLISTYQRGLCVNLFVCSLVCQHLKHRCSSFHETWGNDQLKFMINHRRGNCKNIIPHRLHSGIFKMARWGKLLC